MSELDSLIIACEKLEQWANNQSDSFFELDAYTEETFAEFAVSMYNYKKSERTVNENSDMRHRDKRPDTNKGVVCCGKGCCNE